MRDRVTIERSKVDELVDARLPFEEFEERMKALGCQQVVRPRSIVTRELRTDQSRCFVKLDHQQKVVDAYFG